MSTPFYADLNKKPKDVINSGYHFGLLKLGVNLKTRSCFCFNVNGQCKQEDGKVTGGLETKYTWDRYGICIAEKVNTESELTTELTFNKLYQGLKLVTDLTILPKEGFKQAHLGLQYVNNYIGLTADVNTVPLVGASLVFATRWNWFPGVQVEYDTNQEEDKLTKANLALTYIGDDFVLHTNVDKAKKFGGMIYQRISEKCEAGIWVNFTTEDKNTEIGVGTKYAIDNDASVCCKINNGFQVGLGYRQKLRDGISMCLSALIDAKLGGGEEGDKKEGPQHKLGLSIEFQA